MSNLVIEKKIKGVLAEYSKVKVEDINNNNSDLAKDLSLDSLDIVELIMQLEEAFSCELDDKVVEKIKTVQDLIDCIKSQQSLV
jgi:acyl carrier protein